VFERRANKKPVFIPDNAAASTSITAAETKTKTKEDQFSDAVGSLIVRLDNHLKKLDNFTNSVDNLIYCLCADTDITRKKIIKR
jgi:hypothetical protein